MKKVKLSVFLAVSVILIIVLSVLPACKEGAESEVVVETVIETVTETVVETVEVTKENPYTYENLKAMALAGEYEGTPAAGHILGFNNVLASFPFCQSLEQSIQEQWALAGGSSDDLLLLDMNIDILKSIENFEIALTKGAEVYAQMHYDLKVVSQLAKRAEEAGMFIIAVDQPVPGFPFMGVDNYGASSLTGQWAADQIESVYGGWDNIDRVFCAYQPEGGPVMEMRTFGAIDALIDRFGDTADPYAENSKLVLVDTLSTTELTQKDFADVLSAYPDDEVIVCFNVNDQGAAGMHAAAEIAGRWDPDNFLMLAQGCDSLGIELIRDSIIDGDCAYFPELYGTYIVPAALAHMYGNPVPSHMYVDNEMISLDNIDEWYPEA